MSAPGKVVSPAKKGRVVKEVIEKLDVSERRACKVLDQPRSTQRRKPAENEFQDRLRKRITELACEYGRYGYRRITALLQAEGWMVNHKRVERIWRQEGLKVPRRQPKRKRLWFNDGSCLRLRPLYRNHVWSYDFLAERTSDGRAIRMLNIIDEYTRECLAISVGRKITASDVIDTLADLFLQKGIPAYIRSDNGPEFVADILRGWLKDLNVSCAFIEPGSPWENGYIESFNGKLRDELLNAEVFDSIYEAQVITERWRKYYNTLRPHSALNYRPPAPEVFIPYQVANA